LYVFERDFVLKHGAAGRESPVSWPGSEIHGPYILEARCRKVISIIWCVSTAAHDGAPLLRARSRSLMGGGWVKLVLLGCGAADAT